MTKLSAEQLIDCYVADVARQLPRKQRNDVAFELRALISEGLQDRAGGRGVDAAMAAEFLGSLGRPAEVAARYRPGLVLIDPADGHAFVRATIIGLALIWGLGLLALLLRPAPTGTGELLGLVGQWWLGTVIPSLWWPGMLVLGFAGAAWTRRRWPQTAQWQPRASDPDQIHGGRGAMLLALVGTVAGVYTLVQPHWLLDFFWSGRAAPAAYIALSYADGFLHKQAPWLLAPLLLNIALFLVVLAKGRWSAPLRRVQDGLSLLICALMIWAIADGPILMSPISDRTAKALMLLIVVLTLAELGLRCYRRVRPKPALMA